MLYECSFHFCMLDSLSIQCHVSYKFPICTLVNWFAHKGGQVATHQAYDRGTGPLLSWSGTKGSGLGSRVVEATLYLNKVMVSSCPFTTELTWDQGVALSCPLVVGSTRYATPQHVVRSFNTTCFPMTVSCVKPKGVGTLLTLPSPLETLFTP